MCGIAGFVRDSPDPRRAADDRRLLERMGGALNHRGPDSRGFFSDGEVGLAHARLSVIDPAGGAQPLVSEDGRILAICNGEIYNYRDLRRDLIGRGHRFRSESDSEVLVHLYEEVGDETPKHLVGMFAFAIWDGPRRKLLLGRDRMGQKPLVYATDESGCRIVFASELKALAAFDDRTREIGPDALAVYLSLGFAPDPTTIYRGVRKLEPGCCLSISGRSVRTWRYWETAFAAASGPLSEAAEQLDELLADSVRRRMVADVPVGAFLSGGIDSSAVAGLMARSSTDPIHTFSIGFDDPRFDERRYARIMAEHLGSRHAEALLSGPTPDLLERFAEIYDEPFGDSSALPTLRVSQLARSEVTVALSGDGADEVFGGYERYSRELLKGRLRTLLPEPARAVLAGFGDEAAPALDPTTGAGRWRGGVTDIAGLASDSYFRALACFHDSDLGRLLARPMRLDLAGWSPREIFRSRLERARDLPLLAQLQACDFAYYLPGDILAKVDRASMAYSLEVRSPWLDHRIVELSGRLPPSFKAGVRFRKRIGIPFSVLIRADYMTEESVRDLAESGCFAVKMGVESGNEYMRNKIMHKHLSNEQILECMGWLHKYGIMVQTSNILGSPGETLDSAMETLEFNAKLRPEHAWCSLIQPYPGTTIQDLVMKEGMLPPGFDSDEFEQSYFMTTPVDVENKREITNLQKLFPIAVRYPALLPVVKEAIKLPPNRLYNFMFKAHYGYSIMRINDMEVLDFLRIGWYTRNYFSQTSF